jgi:hypothetical protein
MMHKVISAGLACTMAVLLSQTVAAQTDPATGTPTVTITLPNGQSFTHPVGETPIINYDPATGIVRITSPINTNYLRQFGASGGSSATSGGYSDNPALFDPVLGPTTGGNTNVPEPEMFGLFLGGALVLMAVRRRRRKLLVNAKVE